MTFNVLGEALSSKYLKDFDIIDDFVGNALWGWGNGTGGQLGDSTTVSKSSPVQTVAGGTNWKLVSAAYYHTAAIKTDGTLWIWGNNDFGQLGDGSSGVNRTSPIQLSGYWKQVSCSDKFFTAALKTDGTLWTWGYGANGQLGDNSGQMTSSPAQTVAAGTNWKLVSAGGYHVGAIKTDGTLWTWGLNSYGALGTNNTTSRSSPVQTVAAGTNWKLVSGGHYYTAAIKTDGTLWLWGQNNYGQLGDNTTTNRSSPVQTIASGTNWKQVSCGRNHTTAIKTDGTLWAWGYNSVGQLGDYTATNKSSPAQTVIAGTNWKMVSAGYYHTAAIKTDGTLWTWGSSNYGQLGTNVAGTRTSPVQTVAGGTNWKQVDAGAYTCFAVTFSDLQ